MEREREREGEKENGGMGRGGGGRETLKMPILQQVSQSLQVVQALVRCHTCFIHTVDRERWTNAMESKHFQNRNILHATLGGILKQSV